MSGTRRPARGLVAAAFLLVLLPPTAATADEPTAVGTTGGRGGAPDLLRLRTDTTMVRLAPGETSSWELRLDVDEQQLDSLSVTLSAPSLVPGAGRGLSVSASACSRPFTGRGCEAEETVILRTMPVDELAAPALTRLGPGSARDGAVHVRVDVALLPDVPAPEPVQLVFAATALGSDGASAGGGSGDRAAAGPQLLANTGVRLAAHLVLAAAAVAGGLLITRVARGVRSAA